MDGVQIRIILKRGSKYASFIFEKPTAVIKRSGNCPVIIFSFPIRSDCGGDRLELAWFRRLLLNLRDQRIFFGLVLFSSWTSSVLNCSISLGPLIPDYINLRFDLLHQIMIFRHWIFLVTQKVGHVFRKSTLITCCPTFLW